MVVLLLNGTAIAVASVHMNHSGMVEAKAQVTSHATPEGKMPCHDAEAKTTSDVAPHAATGLHTSSDVSVSTDDGRSEEHTSELQSLMRISYAVFCLKKKNTNKNIY